jgi:hypothetical protein
MQEKNNIVPVSELGEKNLPSDKPPLDQKVSETTDDKSTKKATKKPIYKNPWFWVAIGGGVLAVILLVVGLVYRNNVMRNQKTISDGWHEVVAQANATVTLGKQIKTPDQYSEYDKQLHGFAQMLNDKKYAAAQMPTFLSNTNSVNQYKGFLDSFNTYIGNAATQADTVSDLTSADVSQLNEQASKARDSANTLKQANSYLTEPMPDDIYAIATVLDTIKNQIDTRNSEAKAAAQAAEAQKAKDAADAQTVETNVGQYLTAFVAGNASTMRRYMTQAFQNEFDFNQLTPESRATVYPSSYRIISVKKQDDGNYKASANVLFKYRDNSSQYTNGYEYMLIPGGSVGWLINTEKVGTGF